MVKNDIVEAVISITLEFKKVCSRNDFGWIELKMRGLKEGLEVGCTVDG